MMALVRPKHVVEIGLKYETLNRGCMLLWRRFNLTIYILKYTTGYTLRRFVISNLVPDELIVD
jgi:hypothetical protein